MLSKKDNQITALHNSYGDISLEFDTNVHGPFGDNYACAHAYKKTEKILIALHLVTNNVPEKEPSRIAVRDKSVCILSDILLLRSGFKSAGSEKVEQVIVGIFEVISLLDILHASGFVSDMNLEVLKKELGGLIIFIRESSDTKLSERVTFDSGHFKIDDLHSEKSKGQSVKDTLRVLSQGKGHNVKKISKGGTPSVNSVGSASAKHDERRDAILKLIKDKNSVNVKDVSAVITDCSEKTLQRELISLVNENVLKKEGERRWSVYSLK
jgi:hypothetical protein